MRSIQGWAVVLVGVATVGCQPLPGQSRGETMRLHGGSMPVVFTNATPQKMCGLFMSYEDQNDYGDNWLPKSGLASGSSISFRVKQGKYKARWDTCTSGAKQPFYAATLWREMGFVVEQETQLYAYVADSVAPTKRAAVMGRDHKVVRFQGQQIGGPDWNKPQVAAAPTKSQQTVIASEQAMTRRVDLSMYCEKRPARTPVAKVAPGKGGKARVGVRGPSLKRSHDVVDAKVRFRSR